jgi:hypothetical protein
MRNAGRSIPRLLHRLLWIAAVAVAACVPPGPGPGPGPSDEIGVLATAGTQVFVNGSLAAAGTAIRNRDTVSTGAASSALVRFKTGGTLQLDADTDPSLSQFWSGLKCVIEIVAGSGDLYADTDPCDCVFRSPDTEASCGSKFAASVAGGQTTIILLSGHMSIRRPVATELRPLEQIVLTRAGIVDRRTLSKAEASRAIAWRSQYTYDFGRSRQSEQQIQVPDLINREFKDADALARKLGLRLRVVQSGTFGDVQIVVRQDPPPGALLPPGGTVDVWTQGRLQ